MMWFVFDQLWGAPAALEMKRKFILSLRLLAEFAREPLSKDVRIVGDRDYLRETINSSFDQVRALADVSYSNSAPLVNKTSPCVPEFFSRQPQRTLFLTRIALWRFQTTTSWFSRLPKSVALAQQEFDDRLAKLLDGMADRMEGRSPAGEDNFESSVERLDQAIRTHSAGKSPQALASQFWAFVPLSRRIESLTIFLNKEIC